MSTQAMAWAWEQAKVCEDKGTHLVLLALAEHASPDGICWPARKTIAEMVGYASTGSVTRAVRKCEELKLLKREQRYSDTPDGKKRQSSNVYRLQMPVIKGGSQDIPPPEEGSAPQAPLPVGDQGGVSGEITPPLSGNGTAGTVSSEPSKEPVTSLDEEVEQVWNYYVAAFDPPRAKLGPSRIKGIKRALQEVDVPTLLKAIDGLKNYRAQRPGNTSLETIWKTYKGTGSMVERIEFFASQAKGSRPGGQSFPSADPAIVSQRQLDVQRGHRFGDDPEMVERAERSEAWLLEHGIETIRRESDGYPTFRPRRLA
jgi:hypothetical protein